MTPGPLSLDDRAIRPRPPTAARRPTYLAVGRISLASRFCSRMCADQPATRAQVNIGVNRSGGTSARSRTTADQNSTLVASTRSGRRACSSASAAFSSASAAWKRGEPSSLAGPAQHPRARVFGAVDAVAEAHQAVAAVERVRDPALGVAGRFDFVEHLQHARGRAAVQRARERAHRGGQRRGDVGAGRGDDARGERGGVHAVLGRRDPVGVDRLDVVGVGLAAPADQEALGDRASLVDLLLGHRRLAGFARRLGDERQRHHRGAREVVAGLLVGDVDQLPEAPLRREHRQRRLHVDAMVAGAHGQGVRFGGGQAGLEAAVDEQAPDLLVGDRADQVLDVDAAVAQRATLFVGLGDLGGEGDDAFEARLDLLVLSGPRSWHSLSGLDGLLVGRPAPPRAALWAGRICVAADCPRES